jgi:hypothetical protein
MSKIPVLIIGLLGIGMICCLGGAGAACSMGFSPLLSDRADEIEDMPTTPDVSVGEEVALTGILSDNPPITDDPELDIAQYELVAYKVEIYNTHRTGTGSNRRTRGDWDTLRTVVDSLTMEVEGQVITINGDANVTLGGSLHTYNADQIQSDGSRRVSGFLNGDQVTMVGERLESGEFVPDQLYGGTREELVSDTRTGAKIFRYVGYALMVCGGGIGLLFVLGAVALSRRR